MIDRKQFTLDRLLDAMLDTCAGNIDKWREQCAIEPDTHDVGSGRAGRFVVKCGGSSCLRCIGTGYIWDIYYVRCRAGAYVSKSLLYSVRETRR